MNAEKTHKDTLERLRTDWAFYWKNLGVIRLRQGGIGRWIFTPEQDRYSRECTPRDLIVKPRQVFITTVVQGRGLHGAMWNVGYQYVSIFHKSKPAERALNNMRIMYENLDESIRPEIDKDNTTVIDFPYLRSGVQVGICGQRRETADEVGKSEKIDFLHFSEAAFYPFADITIGSAVPCVTEAGTIVIESSPHGFGDFHRRVIQAQSKIGVFKLFFTVWFVHQEYFVPDVTLRDLGRLDEYEIELLDEHEEIQSGHLEFRRRKISELSGDPEEGRMKFQRDYPSDLASCFQRMQGCIFSQNALDAYTKHILPPLSGYPPEVMIFKEAIKDGEYVISADVSMGRRKGKYCSADIIRRDNWEQVGHIYGKWPPSAYGDILMKYGEKFNNALVAIENDGIGVGPIIRMQTLGYKNLYHHLGMLDGEMGAQVGYPTNVRSRALMIDDLEEAVRTMTYGIHSNVTLDSMRTFILYDDGVIRHAPGCFDDAVFSSAIGIQVLKQPKFVRQNWDIYV